MTTTLGTRLRAARLEAGLSQAALSERTGIVQQAISRYESGTSTPSVDTLVRLADALSVSLDWLTGGRAGERERIADELQAAAPIYMRDDEASTLGWVLNWLRTPTPAGSEPEEE